MNVLCYLCLLTWKHVFVKYFSGFIILQASLKLQLSWEFDVEKKNSAERLIILKWKDIIVSLDQVKLPSAAL